MVRKYQERSLLKLQNFFYEISIKVASGNITGQNDASDRLGLFEILVNYKNVLL